MSPLRILMLFLCCMIGIGAILGSGSSKPRPTTYIKGHKSFDINSTPPGAQIFIDGSKRGVTPATIPISYTRGVANHVNRVPHRDETRDWEFKLVKIGYETHTTKFKIDKGPPRHVKLTQKYAENVSVTGAASALRRITTGGPNEKLLDVSIDNQWLLIEASESGKNATDVRVLQKLSVSGGGTVILTPNNSKNFDGIWSSDNNSVIFISDRLGTNTLVQSLGVAGETGVRFITQPSLGKAADPSVNMRTGEIAFSVASRNSNIGTISIINDDGTNLRMFGEGEEPSWSPDGSKLIFIRKVGDKYGIFSMDAGTGSNLTELSSTNANDYNPIYSPAGNYIAFVSDRLSGRKHLFFMKINGQEVTQLTDGYFDIAGIAWAKNGTIYFSANAGGNWDIWSLRPLTP